MELTYFFLGFPKPDRLAFHQVCNLWTMTKQAAARLFNLRFEAQRVNGSLNELKSIQDGARRGQQLARKRNNDGVARRRERGMLPHSRDRDSAAMEDAIVAHVARTLSAQSRGRN